MSGVDLKFDGADVDEIVDVYLMAVEMGCIFMLFEVIGGMSECGDWSGGIFWTGES